MAVLVRNKYCEKVKRAAETWTFGGCDFVNKKKNTETKSDIETIVSLLHHLPTTLSIALPLAQHITWSPEDWAFADAAATRFASDDTLVSDLQKTLTHMCFFDLLFEPPTEDTEKNED